MTNPTKSKELENYIRKSFFSSELEILDNGLKLFNISLEDLILNIQKANDVRPTQDVPIYDLPSYTEKIGISEKLSNATEEEDKLIIQFGNLFLRLQFIHGDYLISKGEEKLALTHLEFCLKNLESLQNRFIGHVLDQETIDYNLKTRSKIEALRKKIETKKILYWKGSSASLNKLSERLANDGVTTYKLDFLEVFTKQQKCLITASEIDFFVTLFYSLVESEPTLIECGHKDGHGSIKVAQSYFCDKSNKSLRPISFRNRMSRLQKTPSKLIRLKVISKDYLQTFL